MTDLSGIARNLRLSVDQIRVASELLQQGYHPAFLSRYRSDEIASLPRTALWAIKSELDRRKRLDVAKSRLQSQLPQDAELDEEAMQFLQAAGTEVEAESVLKAYRARRTLNNSQDRSGQAGQLLEKLIAYNGQPIEDMVQWVVSEFGVTSEAAELLLGQANWLVSTLMQCDTGLIERMRKTVQKRAAISVEFVEQSASETTTAKPLARSETDATNSELSSTTESSASASSDGLATATDLTQSDENDSAEAHHDDAESYDDSHDDLGDHDDSHAEADAHDEVAEQSESHDHDTIAGEYASADNPEPIAFQPSAGSGKAKGSQGKSAKKAKVVASKMTPRQRRRRWLISMLQPMRSLKKPLTKLTSYQHLMLGRGRRSQLIRTVLDYDDSVLIPIARDSFVSDNHPLARWFEEAVSASLEGSLKARIETEAVGELEEVAQERLLETSADQLRQHLEQRPVRGHTIMLVDTVGAKTVSVVVVDSNGAVLATDEISSSAHPEIVNQNLVKLGELAHKHRVTLVALTNGPARRFAILTLRELMKQSADSGLRWTLADRGGAEAYAAGRIGLKELPVYNRRDRAAIWIARSLQNPLAELLKVDINRLRLGSYQRELPQEPLRQLMQDTISDCVYARGIDVRHASVNELSFVPGISESVAKEIVELKSKAGIQSRQQLLDSIKGWSESDARQAISCLRVFGGEQSLDATAIHPEDYRLAERLVENTELSQPAAAPEGWMPPASASAIEEVAEATETNAAVVDSDVGTEQIDSATASGVESNIEAESQVAQEAPAETVAPDEATSAEMAGEEPAAEPTNSSEEVQEEATASSEANSVSSSTATPEYPENISASSVPTLQIDAVKLANGWQVGKGRLRYVAECLNAPFADSRLDHPPVPLHKELPTLGTLKSGDCYWSVIVGVADFGAFAELGPDCNGLVHISRLSPNFIEDPHQCVQVGDLVLTWVVDIDEKKNRVALTALSPAQRQAAEQNRVDRQEQRGGQRGGGRPQGRPQHGGGQTGSQRPAAATAGAPTGQARSGQQRQGQGQNRQGAAQARSGQGSGQGNQDGGRGQGRSQGGRGGRSHDQRNQGRGRNEGGRPKTVVVKSKKPVAPISQAMQQGEEPLRSFSDLLQFYEAKRTDTPEKPDVTPDKPANVQAVESDSPAENENVVKSEE